MNAISLKSGKVVSSTPTGTTLTLTLESVNTNYPPSQTVEPLYENIGESDSTESHISHGLNSESRDRNSFRTPKEVYEETISQLTLIPKRLESDLEIVGSETQKECEENPINQQNPFNEFILNHSGDIISVGSGEGNCCGEMEDFDREEFQREIPVFDGKKEDLNWFCLICDRLHGRLNPGGQRDFYYELALRLKGEAFELYNDGNFNGWPQFRTALARHFKKIRSRNALAQELNRIRQDNQTVEQYAKRLKALLKEVAEEFALSYPDQATRDTLREIKEGEAATVFLQGLNEPLKTRIYSACRGRPLQEQINIAVEEDEIFRRGETQIANNYKGNNNWKMKHAFKSNQNGNGNFQTKSPSIVKKQEQSFCDRCRREGHLAYECRARFPIYQHRNNEGPPPNDVGKPIKCFKCGKEGHIAPKCFTKPEHYKKVNFVKRRDSWYHKSKAQEGRSEAIKGDNDSKNCSNDRVLEQNEHLSENV